MNNTILEKAKEYISLGLSVVPIEESKTSCLTAWTPLQGEALTEEEMIDLFNKKTVRPDIVTSRGGKGIKMFGQPTGLAIICGAVSGNLEVVDVDVKNDREGGTLWEDYSSLIKDTDPDLFNKLLIARTVNGGYHLIYRCETIEGNNPNLAKSSATTAEVLIETRGEGGYIAVVPQPGYEFIQGSIHNIPLITPEERQMLFRGAMSLDQRPPQDSAENKSQESYIGKSSILSPFDDYNERGDVIQLLEKHGWTKLKTYGQRTYLLRPGETTSKAGQSGNLYTDAKGKRTLVVFSGSTDFNPGKAYSPSSVFILLECNGDTKKAYRELLAQGYGEPYIPEGENKKPDQLKTERIKVEVVNKVNQVNTVISEPGNILKIEEVKTALGGEVIITTTGPEAREETIKAIEALRGAEKRVYVVEPGGLEIRDYKYLLEATFQKYGAIQEEKGHLSDRDVDSLVEEVVILGSSLEPVDRNIFTKEFISSGPIQELGITEEALRVAQDRLKVKEDQEAQARGLKDLLTTASGLYEKGDTTKALVLLGTKLKEVKLKDKTSEFSNLLVPVTEAEVKHRQSTKPESLKSGYNIGEEEIILPSGAVSIFTAPTSHGKTSLLINLALNVVSEYPDKGAYFFSYEEDRDTVVLNALNTYLDKNISANNRRSIRSYFSTGSTEYIQGNSLEYFNDRKEKFFSEVIGTGRLNIQYSNYDSDTLIDAIRYLHKNASPGIILIDYIQLLNLPQGKYKTYSRQEEIKEICIALKDVAVETGLPIVLGAQFNREVVSPLKIHATKIGEAGDIERIANLIVGFWNTNFEVIATDAEKPEIAQRGASEPGKLYAVILKNRSGRVGLNDTFKFDGNTGKIKNRKDYSSNSNSPI